MNHKFIKFGTITLIGSLLLAAVYIMEAKKEMAQRLSAFVTNSYDIGKKPEKRQPKNNTIVNSATEKITLEIKPPLTPLPTTQTIPELQILNGSKYIKLLFVGDIMLGRYVRTLMEKNNLDYPFEKAKEYLLSSKFDRIIANLEGPIVEVPNRAQTGTNFGFAPDTAQILRRNGIDIVSIANNHTLDQGQKGFDSTRKYLQEGGVEFFGNPVLPDESEVLMKAINNKTFAFVGFHDATRRLDDKKANELIKKIDPQTDYVIVFIHWGIEYKKTPSPRQKQLAQGFIDSGADLIIGHHPHVAQTIENYKGVPIVYSLGNFIFDQYWSKETQKGTTVEAIFSSDSADDSIKLYEHPIDLSGSKPSWAWE